MPDQISMGMQYQAWMDMKQKLEEIESKLDQQVIEDGAALTKVTGSIVTQDAMEHYGNVLADAPDPTSTPVGAEFTAIEDEIIYKNTGTYWKEWLVL